MQESRHFQYESFFSQMAKQKYLFFGMGFFILAFLLVWLYEPKPPLLNITQNSATKAPYLYEGFINGTLAVQEINLTKDYLNGVEIRFATMGRVNTSTNTILVLDSNYNLLHKEKFSSEKVEDTKYYPFQFKESMKAGKGNKIYICFFSNDGDSTNCIHALFNSSVKFGNLYASTITNDDVIGSIPNMARLYPGSMILRTHESDSSFSNAIKWLLYIIAALLSILIVFFKQFQLFLSRLKIRVEIVYAVLALVFGSLFVFLNPPFQVPDEASHISRIYELSEFPFSKGDRTIPASIVKLDSMLSRLQSNPDGKTSKTEILSMAKVKLEPTVRREGGGPNFTVPYLPQLLGFAIGKIFSPSPLVWMYFGRFFNLVLSILLVFLAIRIAPFSKWLFFLLALMPKTLYMMASLSYDALVISASFLLIALFLHYAFKAEKIKWRDIGLLLFLLVLLALSKPPYFIIGFLFLIIPAWKIKSLSKYLLIVPIFVVCLLVGYGIWSITGILLQSKEAAKTEQVSTGSPATDGAGQETKAQPDEPPQINPGQQINYIKTHLSTFLGLLVATNFDHMRANMLNNFVGTMGWLDTFLPNTLVNFYLIMLLITALCIAEVPVHVDWRRKLLFFALFLICLVAIETAMYVYSSYVGQARLFGVQGRYFIPIAPLFLLIFYNNLIAGKLNYFLSAKRKAYLTAKPNNKPKILLEIQGEQIFMKYLEVFIIGFAVVALIRGIAAILLRYYQW